MPAILRSVDPKTRRVFGVNRTTGEKIVARALQFQKRLLKEMKLPTDQSDRIAAGTVHAFQGAEADIIIRDLVDSRDQPIGRLYRGDTGNRLVNVAISRAQGKLILIGDPETFLNGSGYQAVDRFRNILSHRFSVAQGNVIRAKDLRIGL